MNYLGEILAAAKNESSKGFGKTNLLLMILATIVLGAVGSNVVDTINSIGVEIVDAVFNKQIPVPFVDRPPAWQLLLFFAVVMTICVIGTVRYPEFERKVRTSSQAKRNKSEKKS